MSNFCEHDFPVCNDDDICVTSKKLCQCAVTTAIVTVGITAAPTFIKSLTRIATVDITTVIEDNISILGGFYEIKDITRKIIITQSYLVGNRLFLEGYIRKNVQYVTPMNSMDSDNPYCNKNCHSMRNCYNDIEAKIKFSCVGVLPPDAVLPTINNEIRSNSAFGFNCMGNCDTGSLGESSCERIYNQFVPLNEPVKTELEFFQILDAVLNREDCMGDGLYGSLTEKSILALRVSLFQNRQLVVTAAPVQVVPTVPPALF